MPNPYASGKFAYGYCDVCGFRYKLQELKYVIVKLQTTNILACPECWDEDHPQLQQGLYPISDPQALRDPRTDTTYITSGINQMGSRQIYWGWNPVGGSKFFDSALTPNPLVAVGVVASVTVTAT